jgi:hypothetical protein
MTVTGISDDPALLSESEIDAAFAEMAERRRGALLVGADPYFVNGR